jgi:CRP/FNR family transcriptional regulator, cyclic AMP receptor protein
MPQSTKSLPDKAEILASHALFKGLDPSIIARLASRAVTQKTKVATTLFRKGDTGSRLYAVCSGTVKITTPSEKGKDAILNSIGPGQVFGEIAALDGGVRTADAVTLEDCEFMIIERRDILDLMREYPAVAYKFIDVLCSRIRRTSEQVEDIVFLGLPARLAKTLLQISNGGATSIRTTQQELSQIIGTSRESTNKQLREWEKGGLIKLGRGTVSIVLPERLKQVVFANDE